MNFQLLKHVLFFLNNNKYDEALDLLEKNIGQDFSNYQSSNSITCNKKNIHSLGSFFMSNSITNSNGDEKETYAEIHRQIGVALHKLGNTREATDHFQLAFSISDQQPVYLYDILGNYYIHNGKNEECLVLLTSGLKLYPDNPLLLRLAGTAEIRNSKPEQAFNLFYHSIKIDRKQPLWVYLTLLKAAESSPQNFDILASDNIIAHELEIVLKLLSTLFTSQLTPPFNTQGFDPINGLHTPILFLLKFYMAKHLKYIDIKQVTDHELEHLRSSGLSSYFLKLFSQGSAKVTKYLLDAYNFDSSKLLTEPISDRMSEALYILKTHEKPVLCPFSGCAAFTQKGLGFEVFLYCNKSNSSLIFQDSHASVAACDSAYFFIDKNLILFDGKLTCHEKLHNTLLNLLSNIVNNIHDVYKHIIFDPKKQPLATIEPLFPHLGHALYNVYSAYGTLFDVSCYHNIDYFVIYNKTNWFGHITDLYKNELTLSKSVFINDENEIFDFIIKHHAMPIFIKDNYIRASLARKIIDHSITTCSQNFLENVKKIRYTSWPLVMLTIRLGNRSWISQCSGFIDLIIKLQKYYPKIQFVIDGMTESANNATGWTHHWMSMDDELKMAHMILENTPSGVVHNSVGCKMHESITWCHFCDAFIAPMGSGMTKYKWIANKPGVAYANSTTLSIPGKHALNVWDYNREGIIPATYIPSESIVYDEEHTSSIKNRSNYDIDWETIHDTFKTLLIKIGYK